MVRVATQWILGFTIAPLRLVLMIIILLHVCIMCKIATIGYREDDYERPMKWWRRIFITPLPLLGRVAFYVMGYWWIGTSGKRATKQEAPIIVANHVTFIEPLLFAVLHRPMFVSRIENARIPLIGTIAVALQAILLDRRDKSNRQAVKQKILDRASNNKFPQQVMLFPEGTVTNQLAIMRFQTGAFSPGLPVQPVVVRHSFTHFDPSFVDTSPGLGKLIWQLLSQLYNNISFEYLPVYTPNEEEQKSPLLYATNVQRVIAARLGVPATEYSFDDAMLTNIGVMRKYPRPDVGAVEFSRLRAVLNLPIDAAEWNLKEFIRLDASGCGRLSTQDWIHAALDLNAPHELRVSSNQQIRVESLPLLDANAATNYSSNPLGGHHTPLHVTNKLFEMMQALQMVSQKESMIRLRSEISVSHETHQAARAIALWDAAFIRMRDRSPASSVSFWTYLVITGLIEGHGPGYSLDICNLAVEVYSGAHTTVMNTEDCVVVVEPALQQRMIPNAGSVSCVPGIHSVTDHKPSKARIAKSLAVFMIRHWHANVLCAIDTCIAPFVDRVCDGSSFDKISAMYNAADSVASAVHSNLTASKFRHISSEVKRPANISETETSETEQMSQNQVAALISSASAQWTSAIIQAIRNLSDYPLQTSLPEISRGSQSVDVPYVNDSSGEPRVTNLNTGHSLTNNRPSNISTKPTASQFLMELEERINIALHEAASDAAGTAQTPRFAQDLVVGDPVEAFVKKTISRALFGLSTSPYVAYIHMEEMKRKKKMRTSKRRFSDKRR